VFTISGWHQLSHTSFIQLPLGLLMLLVPWSTVCCVVGWFYELKIHNLLSTAPGKSHHCTKAAVAGITALKYNPFPPQKQCTLGHQSIVAETTRYVLAHYCLPSVPGEMLWCFFFWTQLLPDNFVFALHSSPPLKIKTFLIFFSYQKYSFMYLNFLFLQSLFF